MKVIVKKLLRLFLLLSIIVAAFVGIQYKNFNDAPLQIPADGLVFTIDAGSSLSVVANNLARHGIITEPLIFRFFAQLKGQAHSIRTGEYLLQPGLSANALLQRFVAGKSIEYSLTIPEGWTFKMVMQALQDNAELNDTLSGKSAADIMTLLGNSDLHAEGQIFPDTYAFPRGSSDLQFLQRAHRKMQQVLQAEWDNREEGLPLKSSYEALILASIVERETGVAEERPQIAGVFIRRLKKGMKLQTDPTVIYGMGDRYKGNIRRKDLREDTPYNTYVHKGLTPTPISMPGQDAIRAVLHPARGKSLYFVAKGNGTHKFSDTLKQHNAAVRKYQLGGK